MPVLKVDKYGRVYQTGRDSENGTGYGGHAEPVTQGDMTLGAAYLKAQKKQQDEVIRINRIRKIEDHQNRVSAELAHKKAQAKKHKARRELGLLDNEAYQLNLQKKALSMGCCQNSDTIKGLSANGLSGFAGMTRNEKAIHQHLSGARVSSAHSLTKAELDNRARHERNLATAIRKQQAEERKNQLKRGR